MDKGELKYSLEDGIKFQIVKDNNKRTPFVKSESHLVAMKKIELKDIEKCQKIVSSDFRRQQTILQKKLEKLQQVQQSLGATSKLSDRLSRRRHSAPVIDTFFLTRAAALTKQSSKESVCELPETADEEESIESDTLSSSYQKPTVTENVCKSKGRKKSIGSIPDVNMARRRSREQLEEINKDAIQKFENIMYGGRRRATIAEGATPTCLFPSPGEISRLAAMTENATGIQEDICH
ncbi:uncharacterized protein LOC131946234 [Physella acuta]|uniref:uncharacterized protein LOC131946234 n=1 Tax=Physella acuta TaxID=109671 RepID=UPI0027DD95FF|nr:uncharacterized protein LOC131946234 [Physella acuta]